MGRRAVILLDTHAWIFWASDPGKLSRRARAAIGESSELGVCAISCWEVAMLVVKGRLDLDRDVALWVDQALNLPRVSLVPLSPEIAIVAAQLDAHGDPADRMILASGKVLRAAVVTKDRALRGHADVRTIW